MDNGFRWLTVSGSGVLETADCQKTYVELKARGVEFKSPPTERFYGIEAVFKDNSGTGSA